MPVNRPMAPKPKAKQTTYLPNVQSGTDTFVPYKPPSAYEFNLQGAAQPTNRPAAAPVGGAGVCGAPGSWEADFGSAHGRCPNDNDRADRDWSLSFLERYGRPPSQQDWEAHAMGGGGEAATDTWTGTTAELLTKLQFPKTEDELPSYLRGWAGYVQQLMQENPTLGVVPLPEVIKGEVAMFDKDRLGTGGTPSQLPANETLQGLLGFPQGAGELGKRSATEQWQTFMNALKYAPQDAQRQLAGLRYNPDLADWDHGTSGWYRKLTKMMPNIEHL